MNKKELIELINNYKPKYLYRRKDGGIDKFEVIDENTLVHIQTGIAVRLDETTLLGKVAENIIDLIEYGDFITMGKNCYPVLVTYIGPDNAYIDEEERKENMEIEINNNQIIEDIKHNKNFNVYSIVTKQQFESMKYIVGDDE